MSGSEWRLLQGQVLVAPGKSPRLGGAEADPRTLWRAVMLGLQLLPPPLSWGVKEKPLIALHLQSACCARWLV